MNISLEDIFSRNELFWGKEKQRLLAEKHIAVFGLGGVGGYCVACLKRSNYIKLNIDELMPLPGELNSCECRENCRQCEN